MYGFTKEQNRQFRELMRAGVDLAGARKIIEDDLEVLICADCGAAVDSVNTDCCGLRE